MPSGEGIPATNEPKALTGSSQTSTSIATPPSATRTSPGRNGGPPGSAYRCSRRLGCQAAVRSCRSQVGPNNAAVQKYLTLGQAVGPLRVVKDGLTPDDRVVVNGMARIFRPGMPVTPQEEGAAPPANGPPQGAPAKTN